MSAANFQVLDKDGAVSSQCGTLTWDHGASFIKVKRHVEKFFGVSVAGFLFHSEDGEKPRSITNNRDWQSFLTEWTANAQNRHHAFLQQRVQHIAQQIHDENNEVKLKGITELWEFSCNPEYTTHLDDTVLLSFASSVLSPELDDSLTAPAAAAMWSLASSKSLSKHFVRLGVVDMMIQLMNSADEVNRCFAGSLVAVATQQQHCGGEEGKDGDLLPNVVSSEGVRAMFRVVEIAKNGMYTSRMAKMARRISVTAVDTSASRGADPKKTDQYCLQMFGAALYVISQMFMQAESRQLLEGTIEQLP